MAEKARQPESDVSRPLSGRYDTVAKNVIRGDPSYLNVSSIKVFMGFRSPAIYP